RTGGDRERGHRDLTQPLQANRHPPVTVGERGPHRPRRAALVAVVEVIDAAVVEVHRLLDQPEPQRPGGEVEILLRVRDGGGDVVQAQNAHEISATTPSPAYRYRAPKTRRSSANAGSDRKSVV